MKIEWKDVPDEVRAAIEPHVIALAPVLPSWLEELHVDWDADRGEGTLLTMTVREEYRWAVITVCPAFLEQSEARRRSAVLHELLHVTLNRLVEVTERVIRFSAEEGPLRDDWENQLRENVERTTVDLEWGIGRLMGAS